MKKKILFILGLTTILTFYSCTGQHSKPNPESRNYETGYSSSSTVTGTIEDEPYINNSLSTGVRPYDCKHIYGDASSIEIRTTKSSECDVVVIVKNTTTMVENVYIKAGGSYKFNLPNGTYQVFFYGGRGWNPNKTMPNGQDGGFVANESYSKDEPVYLDYQELVYELIPQQNGNFSTKQSCASEIF